MDDMEQRYDELFDRWLEEEREEREKRYERQQARKNGYIHPHDPDFISPEEPDAE